MVLSLSTAAWASDQPGQIRTLVNEYRHEPGVEVVDLGGVALGLLKAAARSQAKDENDRRGLELLSGIKRLTVLDLSEASQHVRDSFLRKAKRALANEEMLMEAKDDGETIRVYGMSSNDGNLLEDIVILAEDTLVSIKGKVRMDLVSALIGTAKAQ